MMQYDAKDALATCQKWKAETHATGESINARYAALQENRKALRSGRPMNLQAADAAITANRDEQLLQAEEQRKVFMQTVESGSVIDQAVVDAVTAIGDSEVTGGVHKLGSGEGSENSSADGSGIGCGDRETLAQKRLAAFEKSTEQQAAANSSGTMGGSLSQISLPQMSPR